MRLIHLSLLLLCSIQMAFAEDAVVPPATSSEFLSGPSRFSVQASLLSVSDIQISNPFTRSSYANPELTAKLISFEASHRLVETERFIGFAALSLGFSYMNGSARSALQDSEALNDRTNLLWFPLVFSFKAQFPIPDFAWVTPTLSVGTGINFLSQYGNSNRVGLVSWVPSFSISPALLFLGRKRADDWFGGFSFGTTFQSSFASAQLLRVWSIDLGFHAWF